MAALFFKILPRSLERGKDLRRIEGNSWIKSKKKNSKEACGKQMNNALPRSSVAQRGAYTHGFKI